MGSKARPMMVRIPKDLAATLDKLAVWHADRMAVPGSPEVSRTLMHHLALRRGVELMAYEMNAERTHE